MTRRFNCILTSTGVRVKVYSTPLRQGPVPLVHMLVFFLSSACSAESPWVTLTHNGYKVTENFAH